MCSKDGYHHASNLITLTQKSLRYQRHRKDYPESLQREMIPSGLKLNEKPEILPVSFDLGEKLKLIFKNA